MELSCLEILPNEIFLYELFPLFSLEELYHTFYGLNQRLNEILQNVKHLKFLINAVNSHHPVLNFFQLCISSLTVCLGQYDIKSYSNLRSLTLQYPSQKQRNAIRTENFPFLEFLHHTYPLEDIDLLRLIFSNTFPYLKKCELGRIITDHTWSGFSNLRLLSVSVDGSYGIICVLRACPNLIRLNIVVYDLSDKLLLRKSITCEKLSLRSIFIRSKFKVLVEILKLIPHLKCLTFDDITRNYGSTYTEFSFEILVDVLSTLHQLSYLHLTVMTLIQGEYPPLRILYPNVKYIRSGRSDSTLIISTMDD